MYICLLARCAAKSLHDLSCVIYNKKQNLTFPKLPSPISFKRSHFSKGFSPRRWAEMSSARVGRVLNNFRKNAMYLLG